MMARFGRGQGRRTDLSLRLRVGTGTTGPGGLTPSTAPPRGPKMAARHGRISPAIEFPSTWTRIRLNLRHVPEDERPPQEPLEVDYDPWGPGGR